MPCDNKRLMTLPHRSRYIFAQEVIAWRNPAITWTNVELSSKLSCDIHLSGISQVPVVLICNICSDVVFLGYSHTCEGPMSLTHITPSDAYMRQWTGSALVQVKTYKLQRPIVIDNEA